MLHPAKAHDDEEVEGDEYRDLPDSGEKNSPVGAPVEDRDPERIHEKSDEDPIDEDCGEGTEKERPLLAVMQKEAETRAAERAAQRKAREIGSAWLQHEAEDIGSCRESHSGKRSVEESTYRGGNDGEADSDIPCVKGEKAAQYNVKSRE